HAQEQGKNHIIWYVAKDLANTPSLAPSTSSQFVDQKFGSVLAGDDGCPRAVVVGRHGVRASGQQVYMCAPNGALKVVRGADRLVWDSVPTAGPKVRGASGGDVYRDLLAEPGSAGQLEVVAAPESSGVVPVGSAAVGQQPHRLVSERDHLGAVGGF